MVMSKIIPEFSLNQTVKGVISQEWKKLMVNGIQSVKLQQQKLRQNNLAHTVEKDITKCVMGTVLT